MLSDLPRDLAEEVLCSLPVTSLRGVRSTCKKLNTLSKDWTFIAKAVAKKKKQSKEFHVVMMLDYRVSLFGVKFNLLYPCIKPEGRLISLEDADRVDISTIFHCDGLLVCVTKDISKLVVWNPCSGQTRWLKPRHSFTIYDVYALGYELKNMYSQKVLRFVNYDHSRKIHVSEFEIYNFDSNSWKVLDVNPDWSIEFSNLGVSLNGNTYWVAQDKNPGRVTVQGGVPYFLLCFDFTTERFGPRLPLPFHPFLRDTVALSSVRENQLVVLCQDITSFELRIWISSNIEPNAVSWNKLFLAVEMKPLTGFRFAFGRGSFFVDEKKKVAVVLDKDRSRPNPTLNNTAYIIGEKGYFKKVDLGESRHAECKPMMCSYVPSSVQIKQAAPRGSQTTA